MFREANAENSSEEPGRETEEIEVVEVEGEVEEVVLVPGWSCGIHMLETLSWISPSVSPV